MKRLIAALAALALAIAAPLPALAWDTPVQAGGYDDFGCSGQPGPGGCAPLTRSSTVTSYAVGQLVCGATCNPIPIVVGRSSQNSPGSGLLSKIILLKSTPGVSNAAFNVFLYSAPPTFTSLADYSAYTGPYQADITGGIYIGQATCAQSTWGVTTDNSAWNVCPLDIAPGVFKSSNRLIYAVIEAAGTYTPGNAEKFWVVPYVAQD